MEMNQGQGKAYERVIEYVKQEILSGELRQGQKLMPERELAEHLGVGRNSVREALRTLGIIGVISSTQGAGNFVACNFEKSLVEWMTMMFLLQRTNHRQISELRQGLEIQAAYLAIDKISDETILGLRQIVDELSQSTDERRNVAMDKQLHYRIAQASENPLIVEILQALSDVMDIFIKDLRREILMDVKSKDRLQNAHESMVQALQMRDRDQLTAAYHEHFLLINNAL